MSVSASSAALVVPLAPLSRNSREPALVAVADDQLRSALQQVVGDGPAHLAQANKAKFHFYSPALIRWSTIQCTLGCLFGEPSPMRFSRCACG